MPAGSTYTPIATTTLGSAQSSVTFSSLGSYTDIDIVMVAATTHTSSTFPYIQFNSDTGTNYSATELYGNGTSAASARDSNTAKGWIGLDVSISTTVGEAITKIHLMSFGNTNIYKPWLARTDRASSALDYYGTDAIAGTWRNTGAITSLTIKNSRGGADYNFATGSTFTLYGIQAA